MAVSRPTRLNSWKMNPIQRRIFKRALSESVARSTPSIRTLPLVIGISPFRQRNSVDFPAPLRPITHTNSPPCSVNDTSLRAWYPLGKTLARFWTSTIVAADNLISSITTSRRRYLPVWFVSSNESIDHGLFNLIQDIGAEACYPEVKVLPRAR